MAFQPVVAVLVTATDPQLATHHEWEVRHPKRAETARAWERLREADHRRAHPGDDAPTFVPAREFPCRGIIRLTDREGPIWTAQCDACGQRWGAPRNEIDRDRLISTRLQRSRLPMDLATRDYDKTRGNEAARAVVRLLLEHWGTDRQPHPPFLHGPTGRGKTHMLVKAGYELVRRELAMVRYWSVPDLLAAARRHMDTGSDEGRNADEFIDRQAAAGLLILDDLGAEQQTAWGSDVLHRIIDHRESRGLPVMGATNVPAERWADAFGDRLASRLAGCTTAIEVTGDDYREKDTTPPRAGGVGNVVPLHPRDAEPPNIT
jgi:DNA replication protein DnaC